MELGPLTFKPEDFDTTRCLFNRMSDFAWKGVTAVLRDEANRLLAERLGKAPEVFGWFDDDGLPKIFDTLQDEIDSHSARLVCIEKLEEK